MRIILESQRLILTVPAPHMAKDILKFYVRNEEHLRQWEDRKSPGFYTVRGQKILIKYEQRKQADSSGIDFWIKKKNSPQLIGKVSVFGMIGGNFSCCIIGYKLDKDHVGFGYMTEALYRVTEFLFDEVNIRRIEINILPENQRSINVVRRLGFELEGEIKEYIHINGEWRDHLRFIRINRNWRD